MNCSNKYKAARLACNVTITEAAKYLNFGREFLLKIEDGILEPCPQTKFNMESMYSLEDFSLD